MSGHLKSRRQSFGHIYSMLGASHHAFTYELLHVTMQIRLYHDLFYRDPLLFECACTLLPLGIVVRRLINSKRIYI